MDKISLSTVATVHDKTVCDPAIIGWGQLLSKRVDQFSMDHWPPYFEKASGTKITVAGRTFTDLSISGIGACCLGYANEFVDDRVVERIKNGVSTSVNSIDEFECAEKLLGIHPWAESARFTRSGGEALALAVRLSRASTGRDIVLFSGYHGWHDWYLSSNLRDTSTLDNHLISGLQPRGVPSALEGTAYPLQFDCMESISEAFKLYGNRVAAVVFEIARDREASKEWLAAIRQYADDYGAIVCVDEISSGFRHSTGGYHKLLGFTPDVAVFSKALGNGFAISAVIGKKFVMAPGARLFMSSTNWTEGVGFAAASAVMDYYESYDPGKKLIDIGEYFQSMVRRVSDEIPEMGIRVGGIPGLSFWSSSRDDFSLFKTFFTACGIDRDLLVGSRFYPNIAMKMSDIDVYEELLRNCAHEFLSSDITEIEQKAGRVWPSGLNDLSDVTYREPKWMQ